MPEQSTPQQASQPTQPQGVEQMVVKTESRKFDRKYIFIGLTGLVVMIGGVIAGIMLVNRSQDIREKAATQICLDSNNCVLIEDPPDSGQYEVNGIVYNVFLTDDQVRAFDPSVTEDGCYQVSIENDRVLWNKVGSESQCADLVNIQVWLTQLAEPTGPPVNSQCTDIKIYDTLWNELSQEDLIAASGGATVRLAVSATTTNGEIDQARFTVNDSERAPVNNIRTETGEIYDEFILLPEIENYEIEVKLHHSVFGWF